MRANSILRSDSLLTKLAVSLLKPIMRILVWIARARDTTKPDATYEEPSFPTFGQGFFRVLVFGDHREAILEDQREHYQNILEKDGKDAADQWYYKELPETLSLLILRSEPWIHAIQSIWTTISRVVSPQNFHNKLSSLVKPYLAPRANLQSGARLLVVFVLGYLVALLGPGLNRFSAVDDAEDRTVELNRLRQETSSSNNQTKIGQGERLEPSSKFERNDSPLTRVAEKPLASERPSEIQEVPISLVGITRGGEVPSVVIKASAKQIRFLIPLPDQNEGGSYNVKLMDGAYRKTLISQRTRNVRKGRLIATFDLQRLRPGYYLLVVSRDMLVPFVYPLKLKKQ